MLDVKTPSTLSLTFEDFVTQNNTLIWAIVNNKARKFYSHNFQKFLYSKFDKEDIYQELLTKIHEVWYTYKEGKVKQTTYFTNICIKHLQTLMQPYGAKKRQLKVITNIDLNTFEDTSINENILYNELTLDEELDKIENKRDRDIILYVLQGERYVDIANKYGVSKQRIHQIWSKYINSVQSDRRG